MNVRPKKSLGQHFLVDANICRRIVTFAGIAPGDAVIEIGPGLGHLSRHLLRASGALTAVEIDFELAALLRARVQSGELAGLTVVEANALSVDWPDLIRHTVERQRRFSDTVHLVGNLPYNIAARLLKKTIGFRNRFHAFTFMVQKEVGLRIEAMPGGRDYGYLSLILQYHYQVEGGFGVRPGSFRPPPQVDSRVLAIRARTSPSSSEEAAAFERIVSHAFRHRRKTLANNLLDLEGEGRLRDALESCRVDPGIRPQQVTLDQYRCLARVL